MGKGQQGEWSEEETRDLIQIRGQVERNLSAIKPNKRVWEIVSVQMREKGHSRTPHQCKCKWKNLLTRYKGKETSDPESGKQCPFFDELHEVFTERAKTMQSQTRLSENIDNDDDDVDDDGSGVKRSNSKKRKAEASVGEMLKGFLEEQQRMEMEWRKTIERHAYERHLFEQELRVSMEKRERERLIAHQTWLETEEQRRIREDSRAETRHALFTTLLTQLLNDKL